MFKGIVICLGVTAVFALIMVNGQSTGQPTGQAKVEPVAKEVTGMEKSESQDSPENTVSSQSRTAYISPETGELTSVPPKGSKPLTSADSVQGGVKLPPVKITRHANGTVQADLNGRFRIPLTARIDCDGKVITEHSEHGVKPATDCETE